MYTLRIIEETRENVNDPFEQVIENFEIGSCYSVIKKGLSKEFDSILKNKFPDERTDGILALLCTGLHDENGNVFFIMENNDKRQFSYFIMTDSGKTFERL